MAVRDDRKHLTQALIALRDQDYRGKMEIVMADGSDTDDTARLARRIIPQIRIIPNPEQITPVGLNRAISAARGTILVRCDTHSVFPPDYVSRVVETLTRTGAATVGGQQKPVGKSWFERAVGMAMSSALGVGVARYRRGGRPGPTDTVYLGSFRSETLSHIGGYDPGLKKNQDYELNWRIRSGGESVWFDPELVVEYRPRSNLLSLWKQYFQYGRWKRVVLRRFPSSLKLRHLAAPFLVLGWGLSGLLAGFGYWSLALVTPLFYVGFLLGGSLFLALRRPDPAAILLPVVIPVMHFGWGLGFFIPASD